MFKTTNEKKSQSKQYHRRSLQKIVLGAVLLGLSFGSTNFATADQKPMEHVGKLKIAVLPNETIFMGHVKTDTIQSINTHHVDFVIFTGDSKDGSSVCTDDAIGKNTIAIFDQLNAPTLYSVGDNEWTDCHRESNGSYDPLERLSFIRKTFFSKATTQGPNSIPVVRQGKLGEKFSENSRFIKEGVSFVALHVVGSNNNLVSSEKLCTKKSKRTEADCKAASAEYEDRNKADVEWLQESFVEAKKKHLAGIVIVIQADVYFPFELSDGGYKEKFLAQLDDKNGFTNFFHTLARETKSFDGQVLLIHGDSHYLKIDKAMYDDSGTLTSNFTRLETFGDQETSWIEMTVDPTDESMFHFNPVILKPLEAKE